MDHHCPSLALPGGPPSVQTSCSLCSSAAALQPAPAAPHARCWPTARGASSSTSCSPRWPSMSGWRAVPGAPNMGSPPPTLAPHLPGCWTRWKTSIMWTAGSIAEGFTSPTPRWSNGWPPDARGGWGSHTSRCMGRPGSGVSGHTGARAPCREASVCLHDNVLHAAAAWLSFFLRSFAPVLTLTCSISLLLLQMTLTVPGSA
jgi:hypothetical protein